MGMDAVEIVLRAEELFAITIEDGEASAVRTVGDFYLLICSKLDVVPLTLPLTSAILPNITHKKKFFLCLRKYTPLPAPPEVLPWSPQSVWDTVVAIFVDQQGLKAKEVVYDAIITEDLGIC